MNFKNKNPHKKIKRQVPFEGKIARLEAIVKETQAAPSNPPPVKEAPENNIKYVILEDNKEKVVTLLIDTADWAFANISKQITKKIAGYKFNIVIACDLFQKPKNIWSSKFENSDIILAFHWPLVRNFLSYFPSNAKLGIGIFNLATFTDSEALPFLEKANFLFLANEKFLNTAKQKFKNKRLYLTEDGVDLEKFYVKQKVTKNGPLKLLWAGNSKHSEQNDLKGYKEILSPLSEYMKSKGAELIIIDRATGKMIPHDSMVEWYNNVSGFICASSAEGTPNGVLEAAACGRMSLTTNVGLIPELIKDGENGLIVARNLEDFKSSVDWMLANRDKVSKMGECASEEIKKFSWQEKVKFYKNMLEMEFNIIQESKDESSILETTVFILTVNPIEKQKRLKNIKAQKANFHINIIENVSPMNKAFQEMINRCKTQFFIQVDEDMQLYPDAVSKMINCMKSSNPKVAMIVYPLYDPHAERIIQGVKIYRTSAMKSVSFENSYSCEIPILKKLENKGYTIVSMPFCQENIAGIHDIGQDPRVVYERYFRLAQKWKLYHYEWIPEFAKKLNNRIITGSASQRDVWALAGLFCGAAMQIKKQEESDFTKLPEGFQNIKNMFDNKY